MRPAIAHDQRDQRKTVWGLDHRADPPADGPSVGGLAPAEGHRDPPPAASASAGRMNGRALVRPKMRCLFQEILNRALRHPARPSRRSERWTRCRLRTIRASRIPPGFRPGLRTIPWKSRVFISCADQPGGSRKGGFHPRF